MPSSLRCFAASASRRLCSNGSGVTDRRATGEGVECCCARCGSSSSLGDGGRGLRLRGLRSRGDGGFERALTFSSGELLEPLAAPSARGLVPAKSPLLRRACVPAASPVGLTRPSRGTRQGRPDASEVETHVPSRAGRPARLCHRAPSRDDPKRRHTRRPGRARSNGRARTLGATTLWRAPARRETGFECWMVQTAVMRLLRERGWGASAAARTATRFDRTRRISSWSTETRCERGASWSCSFARGILNRTL